MFAAAVYLVSSAGVLVFQTNCCCSENEKVTLYVNPETCNIETGVYQSVVMGLNDEDNFAEKGVNTVKEENESGCSIPHILFFKLKNPVVYQTAELLKDQFPVSMDFNIELYTKSLFNEELVCHTEQYAEPPPSKDTSLEFLIEHQQLKIPVAIA